jgi:hypothetical protein
MYNYEIFSHGPVLGAFGVGPMAGFLGAFAALFIVFIAWELFWKGFALWHAARNNQWVWFVVLILVHTVGILDIIYLFGFRTNRHNVSLFDTPKSPTPPPPANPPVASTPSPDTSSTPTV